MYKINMRGENVFSSRFFSDFFFSCFFTNGSVDAHNGNRLYRTGSAKHSKTHLQCPNGLFVYYIYSKYKYRHSLHAFTFVLAPSLLAFSVLSLSTCSSSASSLLLLVVFFFLRLEHSYRHITSHYVARGT